MLLSVGSEEIFPVLIWWIGYRDVLNFGTFVWNDIYGNYAWRSDKNEKQARRFILHAISGTG